MNKQTKIFFTTLVMAVILAVGNVLATKSGMLEGSENTAVQTPVKKEKGKKARQSKQDGSGEALLMQRASESSSTMMLTRSAYKLLYDKEMRLPVWVAWHLTADHTNGQYKREGIKFAEDEEVPAPRATNMDYVNSGYDRGHMCPSGDNKWSAQAQQESFLYTNCCPQLHNLNAGDWEELESKCREWAKAYGDIYIVCGPLLLNKKHKVIGKNKVVVPEAFYKVVLCLTDKPKAIGFIYRNEIANKTMSSYVNTVDEVERITGIDFFPSLPDNIEKTVEAKADLGEWK